MITGIRKEFVGRYTFASAYRQHATICIIQWPDNEVLGSTTITSLDPPETRQMLFTDEYGNLDIPISNWIEDLSAQ